MQAAQISASWQQIDFVVRRIAVRQYQQERALYI